MVMVAQEMEAQKTFMNLNFFLPLHTIITSYYEAM